MADTLAHYTFVPWLRQGVAARIDDADHLGTRPDTGPLGRAGLSVKLVVEYVAKGGGAPHHRPAFIAPSRRGGTFNYCHTRASCL